MNNAAADKVRACVDCGEPGGILWITTKGANPGRKLRLCEACRVARDWYRFGLIPRLPEAGEVQP
jgi:hypothetical protein